MPVAFFFMDPMLQSFDARFAFIHQGSVALLEMLPEADLFRKPRELERSMSMFSCGEYILRSAAAVERTSGGITTRLWDDPFEWTLPEELSSTRKVTAYLAEVEQGRSSAFRFFTSDTDLQKQIPAPETLRSIFELLLETVARAEHYQGRAFAIFQMFSDKKLPRV
ncbi:MAG: hypothetical protein ABIO91_05220 [Pyrinomonadaceae bacterium]